jgi:hypothetical protein
MKNNIVDAGAAAGSSQWSFIGPDFACPDVLQRKRHMGAIGTTRPHRVHQRPGIVEFLPALQADLVRPLVDCEYTATLAVMATYRQLEY